MLIMQYKQGTLGHDVSHTTSAFDISVYVWNDSNENGIHLNTESPLNGFLVTLADAVETPITTALTSGGFAVFNFVSAGTYKIQVANGGYSYSPKYAKSVVTYPLQVSWVDETTGWTDVLTMDGAGTPIELQAGLHL